MKFKIICKIRGWFRKEDVIMYETNSREKAEDKYSEFMRGKGSKYVGEYCFFKDNKQIKSFNDNGLFYK